MQRFPFEPARSGRPGRIAMRRYRGLPKINRSSGGTGQIAICPIGLRLLACRLLACRLLACRLLAYVGTCTNSDNTPLHARG
jgi:hypothetical protein